MDLQLAGRVFFVTGGSRGIGKAIIELLLAEGACVATCSRDTTSFRHIWGDLENEARARLWFEPSDVLDATRMAECVRQAAEHFQRLDGVVANAGAGIPGGVLETPVSSWTDQFQVKVHSVLNLVKPAVDMLSNSNAGRVVIINGVTARVPDPTMAAVSAARAAVLNLSRSLAVVLARNSICVNVVNLGAIVTDRQWERYVNSGQKVSFDEWCRDEVQRRGILLGRLGRAEEVAPVVAFLLSPLSSYLTGGAIEVSGGSGCFV